MMRSLVLSLLFTLLPATAVAQEPTIAQRYQPIAREIIAAALGDSSAYDRLGAMVDWFGPRLSGSESLEHAITWIASEMQRTGLENVHTEPVMVPHWVRGEESAELMAPRRRRLPMLGLGGSIGTPPAGITAKVLVVSSFEDLQAHAAAAKGRIVVFNVPFTSYGATVQYRVHGAVAAARVGAVASLVRSVTPYSLATPHTGNMYYNDSVPKIPHAAITVEDAEMLARMQARGDTAIVHLTMQAKTLPDAPSRNVMGELVGTEHPDQVVVLGGHTDSWDVGQGAMDDGGGVVVAWEAVALLKRMGLRPRRTIRAVGWVNEENGERGADAYHERHHDELSRTVLAIESDAGVFRPEGFGFTGSDSSFAIVRQIGRLLEPIGAGVISRGGGGADIAPLGADGVPMMGLNVDGSHYFWYHHSDADTMDKLDPREMAMCVATMAVMAYVVADLPDPLPR